MALPGWPSTHHRLSSPSELLSFSFNPEVVSFLWRNKSPSAELDSALRYPVPYPSHLFQIFLFSEPEESATFLSTLHCTVVTTGILVIVGLTSVTTFKLIQYVRQEGSLLQNLKNLVVDFAKSVIFYWRRRFPLEEADNIEGTCLTKNNNESRQLCKRPSDLRLTTNGSPRGYRMLRESRENSLERRLLTKDRTPLADCDIASGEEDISEIQGQYFGPTVRTSTFCVELMGSSPEESPVHSKSPTKASSKSSPKKGKLSGPDSSC